jgi:hypothetical protein
MRKLVLLLLAVLPAAPPLRPDGPPSIQTSKSVYIAGEPVHISGRGFSFFETVGLLVTHAGGGAEANAGHEWFFVQADAGGSFEAQWNIDVFDAAGTAFTITAAASSGMKTRTEFTRTALLATDKPSYRPGDAVRVSLKGFNPNEPVAIRANHHGHTYDLLTTLTGSDGSGVAAFELPKEAAAGDFVLNASNESQLTASITTGAFAGRVVYHSYVSYGDGSSQLFVLNLANGVLTNLSSSWTNLKDPMNAHWSPDGKKIVFMARPKKNGKYSTWFDIFLYTVGQAGSPANLTNTSSLHDEDPKFSPDGSKIVYKVRPSTLREMDLNGNILNTIISTSGQERSMPYYTADASGVWFSAQTPAGNSSASIHRIDLDGSHDLVAADTPGVLDYYPVRDVVGQFLYTRWATTTNLHNQVYMFDGAQSIALPFNNPTADYSDAYPINAQYVVLSSTQSGGQGGFDLYIADRTTGAMWSLNSYNAGVNTKREELGAAYTPYN